MRTIFVDSNFKCHPFNDGAMTAVETDFFDNKCGTFIEGYCCKIREGSTQMYQWRDHGELSAVQAQYELDMAEAAAAYQEGVNSVYDQ